MSYQSFGFILFSCAALILYYALGRKAQRWVLAAANLAFYLIAGPQYLPFLLVTMGTTYWAGLSMRRIYEQADTALKACADASAKKAVRAESKKKAKRALQIGLFVTIALLAVCKYTGFVTTNLNALLSLLRIPQVPVFRMILPLGISFYSFMALSYILDVYWKRYPAEKNFLHYMVYLSYFPHIVQGPIDRFGEFDSQLQKGIALDTRNLAFGAELALWGFFKKLVIADRLGPFVSHVFDHYQECSGLMLLAGVLVYSIQIYADFSGCIDIVTGVSEMFGIRLRKNFNHPYFSRTMAEFWRRWHISLMEWFKDYVYFPVSASNLMRKVKKNLSAKGKSRQAELFASCFPILVVWMITGLWHGASWNFVIWGLFHAALLIGSQVLDPVFQKINARLHIRADGKWRRLWQMARTYLLCCLGRIFFRAADIKSAFGYLGGILTRLTRGVSFNGELKTNFALLLPEIRAFHPTRIYTLGRDFLNTDTGYGITLMNVLAAALAVLVLWVVDMKQEKMPLRETIAKKNIVLRWLILFAGLFAVLILGCYGPGFVASEFIYEKF